MARKNTKVTLPKYRFLEDFPESIDPKTGEVYKGIQSPKEVKTNLFGKIELHRIAKIKWKEYKVKQEYFDADNGWIEKEVVSYEPTLGELGGWVENEKNLSQYGKCWVEDGAVVVGDAIVSEDAQIKSGVEIGEEALVYGEAVVRGEIGILGSSKVFGNAKIEGSRVDGRKLVVVNESASVQGIVKGDSTVSGEAIIGPNGEVDKESKVYDNAYVDGIVKKNSEIFGRAYIYGTVLESILGGNVEVLKKGKVVKSRLMNGKIAGEFIESSVTGEATIFTIAEGCSARECYFGDGVFSLFEKSKMRKSNAFGVFTIKRSTVSSCDFSLCCKITDCNLIDCSIKNSSLTDARMDGVDTDVSKHIEVNDSTVRGGNFYGRINIWNGITPIGAEWRNVSMTGVTNARVCEGQQTPNGSLNLLHLDGVVYCTPKINRLEVYAKGVDQKYERVTYREKYDSKGRFYTLVVDSRQLVVYGREYHNYGEEKFGEVTVRNEKNVKYEMNDMLKREKEEREEKQKQYNWWKKRMQQIYTIEDRLDNIEENLTKRRMAGSKDKDLGNKFWRVEIARDAVMYNLHFGSILYDSDEIWGKRVAAAESSSNGVPGSVSPKVCCTARHYHNPFDEDNVDNDYEGDCHWDPSIPNFQESIEVGNIKEILPGYTRTWVISEFFTDNPKETSYSENYAKWSWADKLPTGWSFNDMVKYTERVKEGKPTAETEEEIKKKREEEEKKKEEEKTKYNPYYKA